MRKLVISSLLFIFASVGYSQEKRKITLIQKVQRNERLIGKLLVRLERLDKENALLKQKIAKFRNVPIGTIMAWHKSMKQTPSLPKDWVECNGQKLRDPGSPYHGQMMPNLNGKFLFLRGGSKSGVYQKDKIKRLEFYFCVAGAQHQRISFGNKWQINVAAPSYNARLHREFSHETRPKNMSVVWIIKVK